MLLEVVLLGEVEGVVVVVLGDVVLLLLGHLLEVHLLLKIKNFC